jgi:hypothetical protein
VLLGADLPCVGYRRWSSAAVMRCTKIVNCYMLQALEAYTRGVTGGGVSRHILGKQREGGYSAGPGWDACMGLGSPDGSTLADLL